MSSPTSPTLSLTFTEEDFQDVVPHEAELVVLSVIMVGRKVHRVLINQGSSVDVII